jgi:hypothetical protein
MPGWLNALAECHGGGSQCLEFLAGEFGECLLAGWLDPAVEGTVERAGSEVGGEARGQVRYAALAECAGQGRGECGALERRTFLQFGVVGDDRLEPGPEFALLSGEAGREGIEGGGDRLKWRGRVRCGGDPVREQPGVDLLAREQDLPLVGEVAEEGGLGQPGSMARRAVARPVCLCIATLHRERSLMPRWVLAGVVAAARPGEPGEAPIRP